MASTGSRTIDGLRIHYHSRGDETRGVPVLYVHGTGCNGKVFLRHMEALAADHRTVAIDLPGHGASDGDGFRGAADYAHFVARLAAELGLERYVVAGHSLGGAVAQAVAVYHRAPLAGLMLIDTGARLRVLPKLLDAARQLAERGITPSDDPRRGYARSTPDSVIDEVRQLIAGADPGVTYKDWIADDSFDFMSRLPTIDLPAIAICGDEDPMTPVKYHQYFHDRMPDCRLHVIASSGHWPFAEKPDEFDATVRAFLAELPAPA